VVFPPLQSFSSFFDQTTQFPPGRLTFSTASPKFNPFLFPRWRDFSSTSGRKFRVHFPPDPLVLICKAPLQIARRTHKGAARRRMFLFPDRTIRRPPIFIAGFFLWFASHFYPLDKGLLLAPAHFGIMGDCPGKSRVFWRALNPRWVFLNNGTLVFWAGTLDVFFSPPFFFCDF